MSQVLLQRVVFPDDPDIDVLPLYWDVDQSTFAAPSEQDGQDARVHIPVGVANLDYLLDRRRIVVEAGTRASTATYFNAFPASYWRRWTSVRRALLRVGVRGVGRVAVYRSTADGRIQRVAIAPVDSGENEDLVVVDFSLSLDSFGDGGWYWFDVIAGHDDVVLESAEYFADVTDDHPPGSVMVSITTFNRPDWCAALLGQIADGLEEMGVVSRVLVVDQGSRKVRDDPRFPAVAEALGDRLTVIEQPNLGGSGGFARGMLEASAAGLDYILLLDDDVSIEPEGIRRAVVFADLCRRPTIVGGHMFSYFSRAALHSFGERVNRWRFFWGSAPDVEPNHDFAVRSLRATPWLHHRVDVDYNGWWMCLIPVEVVDKVGLALPVFIKWDDAEYGLRAGEAGHPSVSLPGAAVWHVPWTDKDDALDWQAYYHQRNRLLAALLHSPYDRGGRLVPESFNHQVKHVLSMQYSTASLRLLALEDLLTGPSHLHDQLPHRLSDIRSFRSGYADSQPQTDPEAFPSVRRKRPPRRGKEPTAPRTPVEMVLAAASGALRQLRPVSDIAREHPEAVVPARDSQWWRLASLDGAVVSSSDGTAAAWYRRDRSEAAGLIRRSAALHAELAERWPDLAEQYRQALPDFAGPEAWRRTFGLDER
jgi:galactofuranosylgalactofuranosylrhamnosyl-N-acetylglucosaminyl-diphospho-decaprenol beta-1,5/1,6-galactofuranosyltransferase